MTSPNLIEKGVAKMDFKINIGTETEDEVQAAVEKAFSPLFVFRKPQKGDLDEVTDILVLWDDIGLVIEVKSQALSPEPKLRENTLKWARKNLAKAGRQVAGAVRAIRDGRMTSVENPLRGQMTFPSREIKWLYGIIILQHESPSYDPFQEVPQLRHTTVPLHILSFRDFKNLAYFLDTPGDLVNYFEDRSDLLLSTLKPRVHEEETVFQYHLDNLESITTLRARKRGESLTEDDVRPYAEQLRRLLASDRSGVDPGFFIDYMITRAHEQDPSLNPLRYGEETIKPEPDSPIKIATELSKIVRVRRIALGRRYLQTIQRATEKQRDERHWTYSPSRGDCILFLVSPLPFSQRDHRQRSLLIMTEILKHYRKARKAIGIATGTGDDAGRSFDFVYLEGEPFENHESFLLGKELFGEGGALLSEGV